MRIHKTFIFAAFLTLGFSTLGLAASDGERCADRGVEGQGYAFFAPGALVMDGVRSSTTAHIGGGGEVLLPGGVGVGAEVGYFTPLRDFSMGMGILSVNGSYYFNQSRRLVPFVTGGYSMGIRDGHVNLFNYGGGINYWFHERIGLRLEFRDHVKSHSHYLGARVGISFR